VVRVHPRAAKPRHGWDVDGTLHVWLTAPAVEGAANRAIRQYLGSVLDIAPSGIRIERGETSRSKRLQIDLPQATVSERLQESVK
jgi:uncharacterized protein